MLFNTCSFNYPTESTTRVLRIWNGNFILICTVYQCYVCTCVRCLYTRVLGLHGKGVHYLEYTLFAHYPPVNVSIAVMRTETGDTVAIAAPSTIETGAEKGDADI